MIDAPTSWGAVVSRSVMVAIIAFVMLQLKEFVDAGMLDTPGTGADALLIGSGVLVLNAILKLTWPKAP